MSHRPTRDDLLVAHNRGLHAVVARLSEARDEIVSLERRLAAAKARRNTLIAKARRGGLTVRFIERIAGITNARVVQIGQKKARREASDAPCVDSGEAA